METGKQKIRKEKLISFLILIIGVFLRTYHLFIVGFSKPWKFGGLYLEFSRQIFQNNYRMPEWIPYYTQGGIPFAYPPLPFYIESFLVFTLKLPEFLVVNLLPAFAAVLSLILFYILIKRVLNNRHAQLFSLVLFSFFPIGYAEQLEGGGLSESFGTIFIILVILSFWHYYQKPYNYPRLLLAAFVWALTVMASPASAYLSVFIFLTFFIILIRKSEDNRREIIWRILILGAAAVLLSSFYWGTVIRYHGIDLLIDSLTSQHQESLFAIDFLVRLGEINLIEGEPLLSALFIIGLFVLAYFKKYELLMLALLSAFIPRENWIMGIIGALVIGYALELAIGHINISKESVKYKKIPYLIILVILISMILLRPFLFAATREIESEHTLDADQIAFLENIDELDSIEENLVIVGGEEFLEWSPYLTQRTVLNVWYGTEFAPEKIWIFYFHQSLLDCSITTCINQLIGENFSAGDISVVVDLSVMGEFKIENGDLFGEQTSDDIYDERFLVYSLHSEN